MVISPKRWSSHKVTFIFLALYSCNFGWIVFFFFMLTAETIKLCKMYKLWPGKISNTCRVEYNYFIVTTWLLYLLYCKIHIYVHICLYMCIHAHMCVCMHMCVLECGGQRSTLGVFFICCPTYFLRQDFTLNLGLEWWTGKPQGLLSLPAQCCYSRHVSTFWWVLELELRSSWLRGQHFTNEPLL